MLQSSAATLGQQVISCKQSTDWLVQPTRTRLRRSVPGCGLVFRVHQGTASCTGSKRLNRNYDKNRVIRSAAQGLSPMSGEHAVGESVVVAGLRLTDHSFKVMHCLRGTSAKSAVMLPSRQSADID